MSAEGEQVVKEIETDDPFRVTIDTSRVSRRTETSIISRIYGDESARAAVSEHERSRIEDGEHVKRVLIFYLIECGKDAVRKISARIVMLANKMVQKVDKRVRKAQAPRVPTAPKARTTAAKVNSQKFTRPRPADAKTVTTPSLSGVGMPFRLAR